MTVPVIAPKYNKKIRRWEYDCPHEGCLFSVSALYKKESEVLGLRDFHNSHAHRPQRRKTDPRP